jgi:hypothetical protein
MSRYEDKLEERLRVEKKLLKSNERNLLESKNHFER